MRIQVHTGDDEELQSAMIPGKRKRLLAKTSPKDKILCLVNNDGNQARRPRMTLTLQEFCTKNLLDERKSRHNKPQKKMHSEPDSKIAF